MTATRPVATRWVLFAIGIVISGLLLFAAVVAGGRNVARFKAGTAEATVQDYLQAISDRRWPAALETFTDELRERCGPTLAPDF